MTITVLRPYKIIMTYFGSLFLLILALSVNADSNSAVQSAKSDRWTMAGYFENEQAAKSMAGYRPLKRVLVALADEPLLAQIKQTVPDVELVAASQLQPGDTEFDAVLLYCGAADLMTNLDNLVWIHAYSAGVDSCMTHPMMDKYRAREQGIILTNSRGAAAATIGEHAIGMMMSLARGLHRFRDAQAESHWNPGILNEGNVTTTVGGKTILVLGLGAIGKEVAKRANGLGMQVLATRNRSRSGPDYVHYVGLSDETLELAARADVVVNALPLTDSTTGFVDAEFFKAMPESAYYISVGRGGTTDTKALMQALESNAIAGAGLDVTDPEPLPKDHPLWKQTNVIITPHLAGSGGEGRRRTFALAVENLRRFQAGEPLLNVVNTELGY